MKKARCGERSVCKTGIQAARYEWNDNSWFVFLSRINMSCFCIVRTLRSEKGLTLFSRAYYFFSITVGNVHNVIRLLSRFQTPLSSPRPIAPDCSHEFRAPFSRNFQVQGSGCGSQAVRAKAGMGWLCVLICLTKRALELGFFSRTPSLKGSFFFLLFPSFSLVLSSLFLSVFGLSSRDVRRSDGPFFIHIKLNPAITDPRITEIRQ